MGLSGVWAIAQFAIWMACFAFVGIICYFAGKTSGRKDERARWLHRREITRTDDRIESVRDPNQPPSIIRDSRWTNGYW